jgi:ADP-heptose:LPS heptosyltransferase
MVTETGFGAEATGRVLALRALGLGDFLTGIPALRALRRAFPDHELVLAAPASLAPLVLRSRVADRIIDVGELEPVPWPNLPPDLAVDLHGKGAASHRLLSALHPRRLIAFADPEGGYDDGPRWYAQEHEVARWCRLLREEGIPADPDDLDLDPDGGDRLEGRASAGVRAGDLPGSGAGDGMRAANLPGSGAGDGLGPILIHPGAAAPSRRWGVERFAKVAAALAADGHPVVVSAGPQEQELAAEVAERAGLEADVVVSGLGFDAVADLVAGARLVVCGDTGIAHMATAVRTPSVVLFGPVPPSEWGPPPRPEHIALWHGTPGYRGDPHGLVIDPALRGIEADEVLDAARLLLARPR